MNFMFSKSKKKNETSPNTKINPNYWQYTIRHWEAFLEIYI